MVVTQRCGHAGRLGAYTQAAAEQGFVALGFCNSPPGDGHFVAPWGGREGRLSTNPMSFAIPCGAEPPILGDFSTAQTPEGKLRLYLNQKKPLPSGWIVDAAGNPSTMPRFLRSAARCHLAIRGRSGLQGLRSWPARGNFGGTACRNKFGPAATRQWSMPHRYQCGSVSDASHIRGANQRAEGLC
jgi:LDH2 family malate/lactate/ureidoglycolate dehydrogenase